MPDTFIFLRRGIPVTLKLIDLDATLREDRKIERNGLLVAHGRDAARILRRQHGCQQQEIGSLPGDPNIVRIFFAAWQAGIGIAGVWRYALSGGGPLIGQWQSWEELELLESFHFLAAEQVSKSKTRHPAKTPPVAHPNQASLGNDRC